MRRSGLSLGRDILGYFYHVAGVVGVVMAMIMVVAGRDDLDRASDFGSRAFQLTQYLGDVH